MRLWPILLIVMGSAMGSVTGCLSYEGYLNKYNEKYCEVQAQCNADIPCELQDTGEPNCIFDSKAARDCLKGYWTCDDQFLGFESPIPPQVCATVCGGIE